MRFSEGTGIPPQRGLRSISRLALRRRRPRSVGLTNSHDISKHIAHQRPACLAFDEPENPAFSNTRVEPTNRPTERESLRQVYRAGLDGPRAILLANTSRPRPACESAPCRALWCAEKSTRSPTPPGRTHRLARPARNPCRDCSTPARRRAARSASSRRPAAIEGKQARRWAGFDPRPDVLLVALAVIGLAGSRRQAEIACTSSRSRRPACQTGPRRRARDRMSAAECPQSSTTSCRAPLVRGGALE